MLFFVSLSDELAACKTARDTQNRAFQELQRRYRQLQQDLQAEKDGRDQMRNELTTQITSLHRELHGIHDSLLYSRKQANSLREFKNKITGWQTTFRELENHAKRQERQQPTNNEVAACTNSRVQTAAIYPQVQHNFLSYLLRTELNLARCIYRLQRTESICIIIEDIQKEGLQSHINANLRVLIFFIISLSPSASPLFISRHGWIILIALKCNVSACIQRMTLYM